MHQGLSIAIPAPKIEMELTITRPGEKKSVPRKATLEPAKDSKAK